MFTQDPGAEGAILSNLCFRLSAEMKAAIQRRAALRSQQANRPIKPGQVVRELLEFALAATEDNSAAASGDELVEEVMASALFARRALELVLSTHQGLADKLLEAARAEVKGKSRALLTERKQ
jgi:hypothetical protein